MSTSWLRSRIFAHRISILIKDPWFWVFASLATWGLCGFANGELSSGGDDKIGAAAVRGRELGTGIAPIPGDGEVEINTQRLDGIVQCELGVLGVSAAFLNRFWSEYFDPSFLVCSVVYQCSGESITLHGWHKGIRIFDTLQALYWYGRLKISSA